MSALPLAPSRLGLLALLSLGCPALAAEPGPEHPRTLAVGVFAHDRGFASDAHESGTNLNLELQFAPLDLPGAPAPTWARR